MSLALRAGAERLRFRIELLAGMIRREVLGKYRESYFGLVWSIISPLLMLALYTFAFHDLLGARWAGVEGRSGFATMVFAGLIVHGLLAETLVRAPVAVAGQANYVKKLVFPLTVLPLLPVGTALFHACLALVVLLVIAPFGGQPVQWTGLAVPLLLAPYLLGLCGLAWGLAAVGVYVRDIAQLGTMVATVMLFLSPIFFPASTIPEKYSWLVQLNPLTFVVESLRGALFDGVLPAFADYALHAGGCVLAAAVGLLVFRRLRPGFGDVL